MDNVFFPELKPPTTFLWIQQNMEKKVHLGDLDATTTTTTMSMDMLTYQKMTLVYNALDDGWSVKKRNNSYIFTKNHEGKKEVLSDEYLLTFVKQNMDLKKLLS